MRSRPINELNKKRERKEKRPPQKPINTHTTKARNLEQLWELVSLLYIRRLAIRRGSWIYFTLIILMCPLVLT